MTLWSITIPVDSLPVSIETLGISIFIITGILGYTIYYRSYIMAPKINKRKYQLHHAVSNNNCNNVKQLLLEGWDVNMPNKHNLTPLSLAVSHNYIECVKILLSNGADIQKLDTDGSTLLHIACDESNINMIKLLIERGLKVNVSDNDGNTPLHYACEDDENLEIVKFLLQSSAKIDAQNNEHKTPLHIAVEYNSEEIIAYLLEENADISLKDDSGLTAKELATGDISELFLHKKDKIKSKYIKLIDTTNTDANVSFVMSIIAIGIAWYNWSSAALLMIPFALVGFIFLLVAILNKISILLYKPIPIYIDKRTLRPGKVFKGYILVTHKLKKKPVLFTLSNIKTTLNYDSNRTSSSEDTIWEGISEGKIKLLDGREIIYFEIPIKKGLKRNKDGHSWELLLKYKSLNFLLRRKYKIEME